MFLFTNKIYQHFVIFVAVILFEECSGCFQSDEYQNSSIKTGSSFYVECECKDYHYDPQKLKWLDKDNKIIDEGTESNLLYIERLPDSANLHIPIVTKSMSGTYKCVAQHDGREYVHTHNLHVYDPLAFFNTNDTQYVVKGSSESKINCEVRSDSTPIIGWYKDEIEVSAYPKKFKVVPGGLTIYDVVKEDAGTYRCNVLAEETSEEIDKYIKVEVLTVPAISKLEAIPDKTVTVGERVIIECLAEGLPPPEYQWSKNSATEPDEYTNITWIEEGNRIVFMDIQANDEGCYECFAFNSVGNDSKEIMIEVLAPPIVTAFQNITAVEEAKVQISCNATGKPTPKIKITFESSSDKNNGDSPKEIPNNSFLTIDRSHAGIYICNASNDVSYDTKFMYLMVLHKPYFEKPEEEIWGWTDKTITINCEHESHPESHRMWKYRGFPQGEQINTGKRLIDKLSTIPEYYLTLTIGKNFSYGVYQCDVWNIYGNATKIIKVKEAFVPSSIINATLISVSATSATFSIEGPVNFEGPPVVGFKAEYDSLQNYEILSVHQERSWSIDRPFKITSLKPNTTYLIKFAALNDVGAGVWSSDIEFKTLEKSAPEQPIWEDEYFQTSSNGNTELQWRTPDSNGEPIDSYLIRYCPSNEDTDKETENLSACVEQRLEPTTKFDLGALQQNQTYHFELVAHNAEGNSTAAMITVEIPVLEMPEPILSAGAIIGIAVAVALVCLVLLDLLFLFWKRQGILASCFLKKDKKNNEEKLNTRDKKGLLKDGGDSTDTLRRPNNGHKEYEYNKTTGVITGKHSSV